MLGLHYAELNWHAAAKSPRIQNGIAQQGKRSAHLFAEQEVED